MNKLEIALLIFNPDCFCSSWFFKSIAMGSCKYAENCCAKWEWLCSLMLSLKIRSEIIISYISTFVPLRALLISARINDLCVAMDARRISSGAD